MKPCARLHLLLVTLVVCCVAAACTGPQSGPGQRRPTVPSQFVRVQPLAMSRAARIVLRDQLTVIEGSNCAQADRGVIEMAGSETLPAFASAGTVFLNGWKLRYLSGDHHVEFIQAEIGEVKLDGSTLSWLARGLLADKDGGDAYEFCYWYVVLGWNANLIDAATSNDTIYSIGGTDFETIPGGTVMEDAQGPVYASAYARIPEVVGKRTIAILPRGFQLTYGGIVCQYQPYRLCYGYPQDHHVLQLSYVLGQTERFSMVGTFNFFQDDAPFPGPSRVEDGLVSWRSHGILKDNDGVRAFSLAETTTALFGNNVGVVQPPYAPFVRDDRSPPSVVVGGPGIQTEDVVIENVPFQFAIPMLAGWELRYPYHDEHVSEVGAWVHDFFHSAQPATLQYKFSWILRDKDNLPSNRVSHKVNILGLGTGSQ